MARASSEAQRRFIRNVARLLPLSSALIAGPVSAAKWEIVPTLTAEETYTDNVRLVPDKRSDWVTALTPGVSVSATGAQFRFTGNYGAQGIYRANEGTHDLYHQLRALGTAELSRQLLFLDFGATYLQQTVSVLGPQQVSNINNTANRTNVGTYYLTPILRHNFGSEMQAEARLNYNVVDASGRNSADSASTRLDARLASGPAYKLLTWNVAYGQEKIDYNSGRDVTLQTISAGGQRLITPTFALLANVGYEKNNYVTTTGPAQGEFWNLGASWTPSPRTLVRGTFGERYYGNSYSFEASHRARLMVFSASYTEEITSERQQLALAQTTSVAGFLDPLFAPQFPDPVVRQQAIQTFISQNGLPETLIVPVDFQTNQFFLSKSWRASVGYTGARNTVVANFYTSNRDSQQTGIAVAGGGDFAASSTVKQIGGSASWSLRLSEQDATNVIVGYSRNEVPGLAREDNITYLRMSYNHQFDPKLSGSLNYRRQHSESNQTGPANYTENAISALLKMIF